MVTVQVQCWCYADNCGANVALQVRLKDVNGTPDLALNPPPKDGIWHLETFYLPTGWKVVPNTFTVPMYCLCPDHANQAP
jgi:hypothetical protein